ncbi:autotransporter domain-containing protein [Alterisphingorhabdus coralli]|uniref:Autotransporter domain-containing protein n=1 Tax=Alterisphingorhabdus coralli TaxID=3071408 RepID=A0AA97F761_9SPHN|nr:autotransporter domain-containing protein [Parasphingorhabdus sp. SCSIO 66989]WOE75181.1 autotransporter domain-containing protein [Parasphingorhabdus sp. SCSIO 66989]
MTNLRTTCVRGFRAGAATAVLASMLAAAPAMAIVPNETTDSDAIVDEEGGVNGVGIIITNTPGEGGIGICTGSLINPRAFLFAAHCVNDRPASDYDGVTQRAAVAFEVDAFPGLIDWFGTSASNPELFVYNISQIQYDPRSLQNPQALGFIEADIAMATLDTPATGIPTWALLFSTLPAPDGIDPVTGTGYNVNITGYGRTGTALDGDITGIDFRRRAAENILGGFLSLDDRNDAVFGPDDPSLPQNLYQIDFDAQNPDDFFFDFNVHQDDARPNEGITAPGDSGGPLILDAANNDITDEDLVLGVLSGGSSFFGVSNILGTTSFYQPLSLYWQYIAEVNPYRYVGTNGGDGNWEDPDHWVTLLDPNYRIIDGDGNIVNGVPTTPELGLNGTEGDWGGICVEGISAPALGPNECVDLATGAVTTPDGDPIDPPAAAPATDIFNNRGEAEIVFEGADITVSEPGAGAITADGDEDAAISGSVTSVTDIAIAASTELAVESAENAPHNEGDAETTPEPEPLPDPTLANGLPGATGFVPDNIDPDIANSVNGRYFDVTLSGAGTTTLNSEVEIDRLTIMGEAGLDIAAEGDLFTWLGATQMGGSVNVDGNLSMINDYSLFAGTLSGTGTVETPFLTNMAGTISPGGDGTIGTLTIEGNVILASGSTYALDVDAAGNSDLIRVVAPEDAEAGTSGNLDLGGNVAINQISEFLFNDGDTFTVATAEGEVTNSFSSDFGSAVLGTDFATVTDEETGVTSVNLIVNVNSYASVVDRTSAVQNSYAALLDQNRGNGLSQFGDIYRFTEMADAATLGATLEGLAPATETTNLSIAEMMLNSMTGFYRNRLASAFDTDRGGTVAMNNSAIQLASAASMGLPTQGAFAAVTAAQDAEETVNENSGLSSDFALFLSGGFLVGEGVGMPAAITTRDDQFDGFFLAGGLEYLPDANSVFGISLSYSDVDGTSQGAQQAQGQMLQATIYGAYRTNSGITFDTQIGVGNYSAETQRNVAIGANSFDLRSDDDSFAYTAEIGVSKDFEAKTLVFRPRAALNFQSVSFTDLQETGGAPALNIDRDAFETLQGRIGVTATTKPGNSFRPWIRADYVHDFLDRDATFGANFVGGVGGLAPFAIASDDSNWVEAGVGINYDTGNVTIGVSAETTIGRSDFQNQAYSGSVRIRF